MEAITNALIETPFSKEYSYGKVSTNSNGDLVLQNNYGQELIIILSYDEMGEPTFWARPHYGIGVPRGIMKDGEEFYTRDLWAHVDKILIDRPKFNFRGGTYGMNFWRDVK